MRSTLLRAGIATAVICLTGDAPARAATGGCQSYAGDFSAVTPAECPSFLCTHGTLTGDLEGTYDFVATAITPDGGLVGQSTITLANGAVIRGSDTSVVNPDGTFVTTVNIVGGTRQYRRARGALVAAGSFTATGTEGVYSGVICLGAEKDE
jgi:hypothetical protein